MGMTRKQREIERDKDAKMCATLLVAGVVLLFVSPLRWLGVLFLLVASGLLYLEFARGRKRRQALLNLGVQDLDALSWEQFEELLLVMFRGRGYHAELTPNGADFGADLVLERNGEREVVQAKHWPGREVGVKAVQEIVASAAHYRAGRTMVVTSGYFTKQALALAKSNKVELWDRDQLLRESAAVTAAKARNRPNGKHWSLPVGTLTKTAEVGSSLRSAPVGDSPGAATQGHDHSCPRADPPWSSGGASTVPSGAARGFPSAGGPGL